MFNRERKTRNQVCNRKTLKELSSHNRIEEIIDVVNKLLSEEQVDENDEALNHAHNTFESNENESEIERINSMNIAKNLKEQLKLRVA